MVKKITIPCDFKNKKIMPVNFFIGNPVAGNNPIQFQNEWLASRGGMIKKEIMESLEKLQQLAEKNRIPFEDLYEYVTKELEAHKEIANERIGAAKKIRNFVDIEKNKQITNNE